MKRLGYTKFVAQGGDWGAIITEVMGAQAPPELFGIHTNMANVIPATSTRQRFPVRRRQRTLRRREGRLRATELRLCKGHRLRLPDGAATADAVRNRGFASRLAAYFLDHDARSYELIARDFNGQSEGLTRDDILDNITITWLTNTALSGARLYWRTMGSRSSMSKVWPLQSRLP
jgi:hypothetical protein